MDEKKSLPLSFSSIQKKNRIVKSAADSEPQNISKISSALIKTADPDSELITPDKWGTQINIPGLKRKVSQREINEDFSVFEKNLGMLWFRRYWILIIIAVGGAFAVLINLGGNKKFSSYSVLGIDTRSMDDSVDSVLYFGSLSDQLLFTMERFNRVKQNPVFINLFLDIQGAGLNPELFANSFTFSRNQESDQLVIEFVSQSGEFAKTIVDKLAGYYEVYDYLYRKVNYNFYRLILIKQLNIVHEKLIGLDSVNLQVFSADQAVSEHQDSVNYLEQSADRIEYQLYEKELERTLLFSGLKVIKTGELEKDVMGKLIIRFLDVKNTTVENSIDRQEKTELIGKVWKKVQKFERMNLSDNKYAYSVSKLNKTKNKFRAIVSDISELKSRRRTILRKLDSVYALQKYNAEYIQRRKNLRKTRILNNFYINLHSLVDHSEISYSQLNGAFKKIGKGSKIRVVNKPIVHPGYFWFLFIGSGIIVLLIFNQKNPVIRIPLDIEMKLEIPVLGLINRFENPEKKLKSVENPSDMFGNLKVNLEYSGFPSAQNKQIMVMSPLRGEGRTSVALNLACAYAGDGRRVLLIDADFSRPELHTVFNLKQSPGLGEYISDNVKARDIVRKTEISGLSIITSLKQNGKQKIQTAFKKTGELIGDLKDSFDIIILDTPAWGRKCRLVNPLDFGGDDALVVFRSGYSRFWACKSFLSRLDKRNIRCFGAVLNDIKHK